MLGKHPLGLYEKALPVEMDWSLRLDTAKSLGFDFVEISIDEKDERIERLYWSEDKKSDLKKIIDESGIYIPSMCLSAHRRYPFGSANPEKRKKAYELMELAIKFSKALGIGIIQLAGYDVYYEDSTEDSRKAFYEGLEWSCKIAEKEKIILAMEIMDTPFLNSITKNIWYEKKLQSHAYKVYPDIGNLSAWDNNVKDELKKGIKSIVAMHLKDTLAVTDSFPGKFKCVEFGTGCVDFISAFEVMEKLGYKGAYMMEMWTDTHQDDIAAIIKARKFMEDQFSLAMMKLKG